MHYQWKNQILGIEVLVLESFQFLAKTQKANSDMEPNTWTKQQNLLISYSAHCRYIKVYGDLIK